MSNTERKATETNDGGIVADRHLYLARTKKGVVESEGGQRVVEANDPDAAYLLVAAGDTIPAEQVEALGLSVSSGKVKQAAKAAKDAAPVGVVTASYDQETGPALKRAAEERRAKDRASGRTQTEVAVTAPPPGAEEMARDESDEEPAAKK
jgi:hypothetical protein